MKTLWYMGAKGRLLPGFIEASVDRVTPPGGVVLDLFAGTGAVSQALASRYTVVASDVQFYSSTLLGALIGHGPRSSKQLAARLDFERDLGPCYREHRARLEGQLGASLELERDSLSGVEEGRWRDYIDFVDRSPSFPIAPGAPVASAWGSARSLFTAATVARRRAEPEAELAHLATSYYQGVYFGLRQCVEIDSLRYAIRAIRGPYAARRRRHYLAALLCAASVSTSGTSHFAQPRRLSSEADARAVARRREQSICDRLRRFADGLRDYVGATSFKPDNRVYTGESSTVLKRVGRRVDTVYADPPYTADNYSRYYHVLEVLARYDYPALSVRPGGRIAKGRYPEQSYRYQSGFCSPARVEAEFRRLIADCAESGSGLVLSYGFPTGLLFRRWAQESSAPGDLLSRFEALFAERYRDVAIEQRRIMHSGQGDSNHQVTELLVACRAPRRGGECAT
jgi:adenine-specific DNA-methyltransferase